MNDNVPDLPPKVAKPVKLFTVKLFVSDEAYLYQPPLLKLLSVVIWILYPSTPRLAVLHENRTFEVYDSQNAEALGVSIVVGFFLFLKVMLV